MLKWMEIEPGTILSTAETFAMVELSQLERIHISGNADSCTCLMANLSCTNRMNSGICVDSHGPLDLPTYFIPVLLHNYQSNYSIHGLILDTRGQIIRLQTFHADLPELIPSLCALDIVLDASANDDPYIVNALFTGLPLPDLWKFSCAG